AGADRAHELATSAAGADRAHELATSAAGVDHEHDLATSAAGADHEHQLATPAAGDGAEHEPASSAVMTPILDFLHPWALLLLPLAALPFVRARPDTLLFSHLPWLPRDPAGRVAGWLRDGCAVVAIAAIVVGLADPGRPQTQVIRTGRGAEIVVLIDRSRSMDQRMLPSDWRSI